MSGALAPTLDARRPASAAAVDRPDVPLSVMTGYGIGQIGAQIFRDTPATLLPIFLTTMLGVPAWVAGISILVPKLWVIFSDPLMGAFSDRKKTSWGRGPFLLAGAVLTAVGFFLLFTPPVFSSYWMYAVYNTAMFTIASTAFSIYSVPYLAIASEMTDSYHERTKVMAFRLGFMAIGIVIGVGFVQPLIQWFGGGLHGYVMMAVTLGLLSCGTMLVTYFSLRRFRLIVTPSETISLFAQFRMAAAYRPFAIVAGMHFTQNLGLACSYTVVALMFIYVIQHITLLIPFVMLMCLTTILSQASWLWVSRRIGKVRTFVLCMTAWIAVTFSWMLVHPATDTLVELPLLGALSTQDVLVLGRAILIGLFNSGFVLMTFSLLTDTIEYDRIRSGLSREGAFSGIFSAIEKLAFALGPAVAGVLLSFTGFAESTGGGAAQSDGALFGILIVYGVAPASFAALSLILVRLYTLTEAQIDAARLVS